MPQGIWFLFAILSAIFAALVAIFGKIGLDKVDVTLATMARAAAMYVFLLLAVVFLGKMPDLNVIKGQALWMILLSGAAGALSWLCYFLALKLGPTSHVAALDRLSLVFVIVLAALFLGEHIGWKTGVGALIMTVGAVFIALA